MSIKCQNILDVVNCLKEFWARHGIVEIPGLYMPAGAATYHPFCIVSALATKEYNNMYLTGCIRHDDSSDSQGQFHRYVQHYQFQVLWKNAPLNILDLYKDSLAAIGITSDKYAIKFINSKWETTSMGAFGYGYEVYVNDLEVTQFTYFQEVCDVAIEGRFVEMAYGVERLAIALFNKTINEINWSANIPYKILRLNEEQHRSQAYGVLVPQNRIDFLLKGVSDLLDKDLYTAAFFEWLKANDNLNEMDAHNLLDQTSKHNYLQHLRKYAKKIGEQYAQASRLC